MDKGYTTLEELEKELGEEEAQQEKKHFESIGLKGEDVEITHSELMKMEVKPREYILTPILPVKGQLLLHAAAGVGKSHFCFNLAYAAAAGGHFLKYAAVKPRRVVYIDGELGQEDMYRYVKQIENVKGELFFPENILYLTRDRFPQSKMPKLDSASGRKWYEDYFTKNKIDVVIFDSLKLLSTIDENNTKEWDPIQEWFGILNDLGIAIILIHHAGADATKQRGVTARNDAVHTAISLQKLNIDEEDGKIKIVYQKKRFFYGNEAASFEARNHFNGEWSFREMEISFDEKVYELLKRGDKVTQIVADLKTSRATVYRAIDRLKGRGLSNF